jgi:hypothetical protein
MLSENEEVRESLRAFEKARQKRREEMKPLQPIDISELGQIVGHDPESFQGAIHELLVGGYDHTFHYYEAGPYVPLAKFSLKLARAIHGVDSFEAYTAAGMLAQLSCEESDFREALRLARLHPSSTEHLWGLGWCGINLAVLLSRKNSVGPAEVGALLQESLEWALQYNSFACISHLEGDGELRSLRMAVEGTGKEERLRRLLELGIQRKYPNHAYVLTSNWTCLKAKGVA